MRTVGIIAEYNPFHTGHAYHLKKAKEEAGADFAVVVMSPDFVQRGEPAVFDKYARAKAALLGGADLVLELPVCYASGSAEYFAQGAVALLDGLGVDALCFGAETDDVRLLNETADLLRKEPEAYRTALRRGLRTGLTFPQARSAAVSEYLQQGERAAVPKALRQEERPAASANLQQGERAARLLETPNNILGVEYCRAVKRCRSGMDVLPIRRLGSSYGSTELAGSYCSATALRAQLPGGGPASVCSDRLLSYIPAPCRTVFLEACRTPVVWDDLLPFLMLRLLDGTRSGSGRLNSAESRSGSDRLDSAEPCSGFRGLNSADRRFDIRPDQGGSLTEILDLSPELADRLSNLRFTLIGKSFGEITALLKTRQLTEARIRRALLHLTLGIRAADVESFRADGTVFYARILGLRRNSSPVLKELKKRSALPLITRTAGASRTLSARGRQMWELDLYASHLYRAARSRRYALPFCTEYEISPVVL